jgi:hypothetical protein
MNTQNNDEIDTVNKALTNQNNQTARLIHFLEYEITNRMSDVKKPGWTIWAILGAIASAIWLTLSVIETSSPLLLANICLIFLLLSILCSSLYILINNLNKIDSKNLYSNVARFDHVDSIMSQSRLSLIWIFLWSIILIYIFFESQLTDLDFIKKIGYAYLFTCSTSIFIVLIFSFFHIPFPKEPQSKNNLLSIIIGYGLPILGVVTVISSITYLNSKQVLASISEYKISFLVFAISILLLIMTRSKQESSLLIQLKDIYKKLSLGQIDHEVATKQVDIILNGMTLSEALQLDISSILSALRKLQQEYQNQTSEISILLKYFDPSLSQGDESDVTIIKSIRSSLANRTNVIVAAKKDIAIKKKRLQSKISFIRGASSAQGIKEIDNVYEEISEVEKNLNKTIDTSFEQYKQLEEKLDSIDQSNR